MDGDPATALSGAEAGAATLHSARTYKVRGLDCAEEVAMLKKAVGPLVGGAERLAFDIWNGRMTIADNENEIDDAAVLGAVAATGMSAVR